ncbi:MAG: DUF6754 domain-containing protein [Planctomycetota bacterium]
MKQCRSRIATSLLALAGLAAALLMTADAVAQAPAPPTSFAVKDHPLDKGDTIDLRWAISADDIPLTREQREENKDAAASKLDPPHVKPVSHYEVFRAAELDGKYSPVGRVEPDKWEYKNGEVRFGVEKCMTGEDYWFKVVAVAADGTKSTIVGPEGPVQAQQAWFDGSPFLRGGRFWMMVITVILCGAVIYWINHARQGRPINVRKIAGLEAVDDAVGRATEMGRSVLFIPGIQDMNDIQTIAGITVLSRVAKTASEYDAKIEVPTSRALVMTAARETVQASFLATGRPDAFNEDLIYYVTDEQFGYVAYLQGMMVREKPAACFYMGSFFAESLILAETGNSIGAIQVAGTAQPAQLPFFVAACDYTLIGEEFFAASAYLSGSAEELGSLKGQDVGKVVVAFGLIVGVFTTTVAHLMDKETSTVDWLAEFIKEIVMA